MRGDIPNNRRSTHVYDSLGGTLDLLCMGGTFDAGSFIDDQLVSLLFPIRATGPVSLVAVSGESAGESWAIDQAMQRIKDSAPVMSRFFDKATDLDLHAFTPEGTRISDGNTSSDSVG